MREWITWASPSKGHRTILTWLWLSLTNVSERTAGRQEERERERESLWIDDSTCSLALCWRSQTGRWGREANQLAQRRGWVCLCILQSAALTFYRSGRIYACVCVCDCRGESVRLAVKSVCQRAWVWMVFVWARQSAPAFTASAGPCVWAPITTSRLLSAHRRLKVEGVKACIPPEVRIISGRWTQPTAMTEMYNFSISFLGFTSIR